jgi:DNA-binding NarL/FixJ family response regulator
MKLLLTRETSVIHKYLDGCELKILFVDEIYGREGKGQLWKMSNDEYWADQIVKNIDREELANLDTIIIDIKQGTQGYNMEILIAGHLALHRFKTIPENSFSIILTGESHLRPEQLRNSAVIDFFALSGTFYSTYSELFSKKHNPILEREEFGFEQIGRQLESINWKEFYVPYNRDNRHQISNEWGALRLAANAGFEQDEINYDYPSTLFFKFLTRKHQNNPIVSEKLCFGSHPALRNKKILLIDDNADKGWEAVLKQIFDCELISVKNYQEVLEISKYSIFDLVFQDLYMPNLTSQKIEKETSLKVLKYLKQKFPNVPIIIFTASNKSWTYNEVTELGADGMYVKESPEFAGDQEYSKGNFKSFLELVKGTLDKYQIIRPYWESIQVILNSSAFKAINEKSNTKFKDRIDERLKMFYGLLKRGFEQTKFNQENFHFSDYELAFMTLWSILNEISEAFYDKEDNETVFELTDRKDITWNCRPPRNNKNSNWKIRGTIEYLIKHRYEFEGFQDDGSPVLVYPNLPKLKSSSVEVLILRDDENCTYSLPQYPDNRLEITKEIGPQIGFLIRKCYAISYYQRDRYCECLYKLNSVRNKLYLTHGDYIRSGFFSMTEKEKRGDPSTGVIPLHNINPKGDIKNLFELIAFLLTGETIELQL